MRLRSRLLILVVAMLLPAVIAAMLVVSYVYIEENTAYRKSILDFSRTMALVLDKEMAEHEMMLRTLSESPALTRNDFSGFYEHARAMASTRETTIILSDLSGQQFLNTRVPFGTTDLPKSTAMTALRERFGPDGMIVSNIYFAPVGKNYSFGIQIPVKRNGKTVYYLSMGAFASQLQSVLNKHRIPKAWIGTILDREGIAAARTADPQQFVGKPVGEGLRRALRENSEGSHAGRSSFSGVPVTAIYNRAPQSGWSFVVSVPNTELQRTAVRAATIVIGISLVLLAFGVALALYVARKTTASMEALRISAEQLGRGEPVLIQGSGILEIDAISTEMNNAGEKIRRAKTELERRVAEAVDATIQAQRNLLQTQKLEALGRLTGGIAHDFNNVLQTLTTGLQVAAFSVAESRGKAALDSCERAVRRAGDLTRQLMAFGRVQDAHLVTVHLPEQIMEVTPMLQGSLRADIDLRFDMAADVWPVTLDLVQFELALVNLCVNARDAMAAGGVLTLRLRNVTLTEPSEGLEPGEYVQLAVIDSGHGMDHDTLAKALDPFFTTKPVGKGSGMGLPQAYGFARQTGGVLTIESMAGKGVTVYLYLPRTRNYFIARELPPDQFKPAFASGKILFVEDDALVSGVVGPALEAAGFDVRLASNAEEALGFLNTEGPFDALFSDVVMPGALSGIDLAEIVRDRFPGVQVVLATGYSERRVSIPGVRILAKPYAVADIIAALTSVDRVRP